jgi:DNA topoisomerase-1
VASGRDFTSLGELASGREVVHLDGERAAELASGLRDQPFTVASVDAKPYTRRPYPPFRTTTLQQEASRKLGFGASVTMQIAQRLYENGFITYMRTDSVTLSPAAIEAARDQARELFGAEYVPDAPRAYTSKVKNAQEAHEAIRPSGENFRTPAQTGLTGDQFRLYELIWMRTVASQMSDARGRSVSMRLRATVAERTGSADFAGSEVELAASGRVITFHGFLKAYVESLDDPDAERDDRESRLPDLAEGDMVAVAEMAAEGHETRPPARFTEATLVRELEEREIGRPSTYASIIRTILDRGYVYKKGTALVPSWLAFSVTRLLEAHFARLVDYDFTARLEDVLDEIAGGRDDRVEVLTGFWYGDAAGGGTNLRQLVGDLGDIDARLMATFPIEPEEAGIVLRVGRYGPYVEDSEGKRGNVPEDLPPDELTIEKARELLANPAGEERVLGTDPDTGRTVVAKNGRYGPYVTELLPDDESGAKSPKPRTGSLFRDMSLDTVSLDDALRLLSLPRTVGTDPESGEPITAQNGRYGPYLKKGTDSRSLESEDQIFGITLEEALAIYAQPKQRGRAAAAKPLQELGDDPGSGKPVVVKDGRFGPYVTDGETNATLRKGDDPQSITMERAAELLAEKRARGPVTKKRTAKKTAAKRTAKKTTAKKTPAKKG